MPISKTDFYTDLQDRFRRLVEDHGLSTERIEIASRALTAQEAIGTTQRQDFPILTGKEIMLQAEYKGALGQAFTDSPAVFRGTLEEILRLDTVNDPHARGLFVASLNAVMRQLGLAEGTVHCRDREPELCAEKYVEYIKENYGQPRVALVGFQPALLEHLSKAFDLRVLDLNPDNVGKVKYGVTIEHGIDDYDEVVGRWAELVLCTGSTLSNGTITKYIGTGKKVVFFGTTLSGAAALLGLKRICFCGK